MEIGRKFGQNDRHITVRYNTERFKKTASRCSWQRKRPTLYFVAYLYETFILILLIGEVCVNMVITLLLNIIVIVTTISMIIIVPEMSDICSLQLPLTYYEFRS